jgi:hypothetical protein
VSSRFMSRLVGSGLAVCAVLGAAPAAAMAGPITSKVIVSSKTLKPGVLYTHSRITVRGAWGVQNVYKLSWPIGDHHVRLHSSLLGSYDPSSGLIMDHPISHLASAGGPAGMIAAMTGDYSVYVGWNPTTSRTSGMLVQNRQVFRIGDGGPAVGYQPNGKFIMGEPMVRPAKIELPGVDVTVGAQNPGPVTLSGIRSDQVAVYTAGTQVTIPTGYIGVLVQSTALQTDLHGTSTYVNPAGAKRAETVVAFRFTEPTAALRTTSMPIVKASGCATNVCEPHEAVVVPAGETLVVAETTTKNQFAADGLKQVAARLTRTPALVTTIDSAGWDTVTDVTAGKPELVREGTAIRSRPWFVDPWQWDCGGGCWRPALVRSGNRGWLIVMGGAGGSGLTMPQFAGVLRGLGATDAMGFDNNNSAELWRPGHQPITGYGYERLLPTATTLAYRG